MDTFSPEETRRYARHLVLRGIGGDGQQKQAENQREDYPDANEFEGRDGRQQ